MKKYIAPAFQVVNLNSEDTLLAGSFGLNNTQSTSSQLSNQRQPSASSTIWGFDDEAE